MTERTPKRMSSESVRAAHDLSDLVGPRLLSRIETLGLTRNALELQLQGYTVVPALLPEPATRELREGILEAAAEAGGKSKRFGFGPNTTVLYDVLITVPKVREILLDPSLTMLLTLLLGDGFVANLITGSVFEQGCMAGPVHSDNEFQPEPFTSWASVATGIWCCDEFTAENGATSIAARSHLLRRHPRPGEGEAEVRTIAAPAGSLILWNGATWHASGARTAPGERVVLHTSFCRMHVRSLMSFADFPKELLEGHPPALARLLGADSPFGFGSDGPSPKAMARAKARVNSQGPW